MEIHRLTALASKALVLVFLSVSVEACETIGHMNRNPTNLRQCGRHWESAIAVDPWGHLVFPSDEVGLRIAFKVLKTYNRKYHIHSIERLCGRWVSPNASWKAKQNWIRTVRQRTKTKPGAKLLFTDPEMARAILRGIVWAENSCDSIPESVYVAATTR